MKRQLAICMVFLGITLLAVTVLRTTNWMFLSENKVHQKETRTDFPASRILNPQPNSEYYTLVTTTFYEKRGTFPFIEKEVLSTDKRVMQHKTKSE